MKAKNAARKIRELIEKYGGRFSTELGIDLRSIKPDEIFKWFMASLLFGARISQEIAVRTYRKFERAGITSPRAIISAGWSGMIPVLGAGGYARYDNRTANKLLGVTEKLLKEYGGNMLNLIEESRTPRELEMRLRAFKGVGEVTANIFLRELRGVFPQADPALSKRAFAAARELGFAQSDDPAMTLRELKALWKQAEITEYDFTDFEAALVRYAR
ncbi:MAG: hypothetical protein M1548_00810 [Actinobacteria bacterium]|nr:hypothetical protein [Actinomycetota bacterium]